VDDGSTDRSAEIVRARTDPRVRILVNEENVGLARSLNRGIANARGKLIARLDADDLAEPDRLARQVAHLDAHPDVWLVGSWYLEMSAEGVPGARRTLPTEHWDLRWHLCLYCPFVHSAVVWRRALVDAQVGRYDEQYSYSMDYDLWRRIAVCSRVANVPEPLVRIRTHARSMTSTFDARAREGIRLRAAYASRLLGWPAADVERNEQRFENLYALLFGASRGPASLDMLSDARELLRFHEAFVRTEQVPATAARRQRRWLRARLARRLLGASRAWIRGRAGSSA
jgi:glycosyltransferase involved in cell wall biosynthesis